MTTYMVSNNYYEREVLAEFDPFVLAEICYDQLPPDPEETGMLHITSFVQHQSGEFIYEIRRDQVSSHYRNLGDLLEWHIRNLKPLRVEVSYVSHTTKEQPEPVRRIVCFYVG